MPKTFIDTSRRNPEHVRDLEQGRRTMTTGVEIEIPLDKKNLVLFEKLESHNPDISDTNHGEVWREQYVMHPNLLVKGLGSEERSSDIDDGLILDVVGRPEGSVYIDMASMRFLSPEEAEREREVFQREYPEFIVYRFRIESLVLTDGPQQARKLQEAMDQQEARGKADLFGELQGLFKELRDGFQNQGNPTPSQGDMQSVLAKLSEEYSPQQVAAMMEAQAAEAETVAQDAEIARAGIEGVGEVAEAEPEEVGAA